MSAELTAKIARYAANRLNAAEIKDEQQCYSATQFLSPLRTISREAELVYGWRAMERTDAGDMKRRCIQGMLATGGPSDRPSEEAFNRWGN
jgi:hypothetical protein